ncbi:MAG: SusC/RagA family TonB-linked outer membrane protein [Mediterranea sp.]|jgi:TonB-linked SusC/RagA family outer membrane protein|nr:SusC/RagA family TonB-linked outer membrane protein [Mediterranea sp.]
MYTKNKNRRSKPAGLSRLLLVSALLFAMAGLARAQEEQVLRGRIVDTEGNPVPGATVNVSESSRIALTDADGYFNLKGVKAADELYVKCVGYYDKDVVAELKPDFQVVLKPELDDHSFTMPLPFGRKQDRFITEATSVVTGDELKKHPITVLQNAFTSTVTGVETYEWSSEPGWTESAMYIRGLRTMNVNARSPLIIVDNVERDLSFLDAFPIENITILKDAAAASIYGMRGANGAIIVTTKRGTPGRTSIDFTQEVGFQTLSNRMEVQNSYNMALTRNQVRYLNGQDPLYSADQIEMYRRATYGGQKQRGGLFGEVWGGEQAEETVPALEGLDRYRYFNTNWFEELYRESAPIYRTNLTVSGGNKTARYFVAFTYLRQEGMWNDKWTEYNPNFSTQHVLNRYNLRSNIDIDVNKYLNVSLDLGGRIDNIHQPLLGVFDLVTFGAVEANPMEPVYTPGGLVYASSTASNAGRMLASSGININRRRNVYSTVNVTGDLGALVPGLKANAMISFDSYETFMAQQSNSINSYNYDYLNADVTDVDGFTLTPFTTYTALTNPSTTPREYYYNINFNAGLHYDRTFGKHAVSARAFIRTYQGLTQGSQSSSRFISYNGQATYVYDNRYIASGNISRMGNDNFAPGDRFGTFYGGSLGWVASSEPWLKHENVNLLKLRLSYGRAGQANTGAGRYPYQGTFASGGGYNFGTSQSAVNGFYESAAGNLNSKWEISDMANIGLDFDFFDRKLYGSVDVFKEWRSNILVTRSTVPVLLGVTAPQDSYGKAESKGFEVSLGHENRVGDFKYHIQGMVTWNTNKVTEMDELPPNVPWQAKTGKRIFDGTEVAALYEGAFNNTVGGWSIYRFTEWASDPERIATSQADAVANPNKYPYNTSSGGAQPLGTAVFQDLNGDRQIDSNDMIPSGYTLIPELIPSLNVGFEYKGFDARVVLNAYLNRSVFLSPAISFSGWSNMGTHEVTKAWGYFNDDPTDPRNVNAVYPRPVYGGFNAIDSDRGTGTYKNDIWVRSGDYLSLRNIEIGYSLPRQLLAKVNLTKCRFYFSGYNLANWSDLPSGTDPEKPMSYCWWYPKTRSFSFGINVGF